MLGSITDARTFNSVIYYVALALGAVSVILAWFTNDITPLMTNHLAVDLKPEAIQQEEQKIGHVEEHETHAEEHEVKVEKQ
jgi:hypothetical protein